MTVDQVRAMVARTGLGGCISRTALLTPCRAQQILAARVAPRRTLRQRERPCIAATARSGSLSDSAPIPVFCGLFGKGQQQTKNCFKRVIDCPDNVVIPRVYGYIRRCSTATFNLLLYSRQPKMCQKRWTAALQQL